MNPRSPGASTAEWKRWCENLEEAVDLFATELRRAVDISPRTVSVGMQKNRAVTYPARQAVLNHSDGVISSAHAAGNRPVPGVETRSHFSATLSAARARWPAAETRPFLPTPASP